MKTPPIMRRKEVNEMKEIEKMAMELSKKCRENGLNFMIVIEDGGIHDNYSVKGKTVLQELVKTLKTITKK
jgi:hypothetical protein